MYAESYWLLLIGAYQLQNSDGQYFPGGWSIFPFKITRQYKLSIQHIANFTLFFCIPYVIKIQMV